MEKLLQLLNEYRLEKGMSEYTKYISETGYFTRKSYFYEHYSWVISKNYNEYYEDWESLLMHLSIQDDPINFLISILK